MRTLLFGILILSVLVINGCKLNAVSPKAQDNTVTSFNGGTVYIAQLAELHPLYAEVLRVQKAIESLRSTPDFYLGTGSSGQFITEPTPALKTPGVAWPADLWDIREDEVRDELNAPLLPQTDKLPIDLQSELDWQRARMERDAALELLKTRAAYEAELVEYVLKLYRDNQDALEAEATSDISEDQNKLRVQLENNIKQLRQIHEIRLEELASQLDASSKTYLSQAAGAMDRRAQERRELPPAIAYSTLKDQLLSTLSEFSPETWQPTKALELPAPPQINMVRQPDRQSETVAELIQLRHRVAENLVECCNETMNSILQSTRLAIDRIARQNGFKIKTDASPLDTGNDVTPQVVPMLKKFWENDPIWGTPEDTET